MLFSFRVAFPFKAEKNKNKNSLEINITPYGENV